METAFLASQNPICFDSFLLSSITTEICVPFWIIKVIRRVNFSYIFFPIIDPTDLFCTIFPHSESTVHHDVCIFGREISVVFMGQDRTRLTWDVFSGWTLASCTTPRQLVHLSLSHFFPSALHLSCLFEIFWGKDGLCTAWGYITVFHRSMFYFYYISKE